MTFTAEQLAAIAETAEFDRWFRAINATRRASGVRLHTRTEALAIWLTASA